MTIPRLITLLLASLALWVSPSLAHADAPIAPPLRIVVMDPLCEVLACDCVAGYAQRKYRDLGAYLQEKLRRPVEIAYSESLLTPQAGPVGGIDLVIGKTSVVRYDARQARLKLRTLAMLTGQDGTCTQTGLFVVRQDDPARSIADLDPTGLLLGPEDSDEKRAAALAALDAFNLPLPPELAERSSCNSAALAVFEKEADAAVISSYAMPLLEGCGTIDKGALRIVGRTDAVPFIGVFATDRIDSRAEAAIVAALLSVGTNAELLTALESRDGFVALPSIYPRNGKPAPSWPDWRGRRRDAISRDVPQKLPPQKRLLWEHTLTGHGMSGLAVAGPYVVTADKAFGEKRDVFRCLDADSGRQLWKIVYPAAGEMDFTNSPRANPVIAGPLVYLLGAFGDLHCLRVADGTVVWKRHLAKDFDAELPTWGFCSTPLIVGDKLIVNPGAAKASLVALDRHTGKIVWQTAGDPPGYGSFILANLGGVWQVVGYDVLSLGGWHPETGRRLWTLTPKLDGDFNVPTPIAVDGNLLVATENNGTRLYAFDDHGRILPKPLAENEDLTPDTSTPIVVDGLVLGSCGRLMCLDLNDGLKELWYTDDDPFVDYTSFIGGNGRILAMTQSGALCLLAADKSALRIVSRLDLFDDVPATQRDVWSHPALVGNRLYVRNLLGVYCFLLEP